MAAPLAASPSTVHVKEDNALIFSGATGISISLADIGWGGFEEYPDSRVSVSVAHGSLSAPGVDAASALFFMGTEASLNAALATLQYRPAPDYNGSDKLTAVFSFPSASAQVEFASVPIAIAPVPDIVPDTFTTPAGTPITFNVYAANPNKPDNFEDPGHKVTSVTQLSKPDAGVLNWNIHGNGDGAMTFTPKPGFTGTVTFTYTVTSGGVTETTTVTIDVLPPPNQVPTQTLPATLSAVEDTALAIGGISVADPDSTNVSTTVSVLHGTLSTTGGGAIVVGNGTDTLTLSGTTVQVNAVLASLSYIGVADYNGADLLTVKTSDGLSSVTNTLAFNVAPVVDIVGDALSTSLNTPITANLIGGANGASADNFEGAPVITSVTQGAHGSVAIGIGGNVTYTPGNNFSGTDSFTYTVTSGGVTETAAVTVNVSPASSIPGNNAPVTIATLEDVPFSFSGANQISISDPDKNLASVQLSVVHGTIAVTPVGSAAVVAGANGSVTLTLGGSQADINASLAGLTYVPFADYNGADTLGILSKDATNETAVSSVAITVAPVADIVADQLATSQNTAITANLVTGTHGASADNFEGEPAITSVTQGAHGSVAVGVGGNVTYLPGVDYIGNDTFTYTVSSGGVTETATVTVTISPGTSAPGNGAPATIATTEDLPFSFSGANQISVTDADNNVTSVQLGVAHGTLAVTPVGSATIFAGANGSVTLTLSGNQADINASLASLKYVPSADFNGSDTLTIVSKDATSAAAVSNVAIAVAPVADIVCDQLTTNEGIAVTANLIIGTSGASADNFEGAPVITSVTQGAHGSVVIGAGGNVTYTPNANFTGIDRFRYTVTSGGVTESTTVTVDVKPNPPLPVFSEITHKDAGRPRAAEVTTQPHALFVHYAVHGKPVPFDPALFVQHAVRDSQEQSILLAREVSQASTAPMREALFDSFSLSAPRTEFVSPAQQALQVAQRAAASPAADAQAAPAADASARGDASGAAGSFSSQLRRAGEALRTSAGRNEAGAKRASPAVRHRPPIEARG